MKARVKRKMLLCGILAMVIGAMGCSSSNSGSDAQPSTGSSAAPTVSATPAATAAASPAATESASIFPLKEKASFEIFTSAHDTSPENGDEPIFAELEKRTNVHLNLTNIPNASYGDKFNVTMASGNLPDSMGMSATLAKQYGMDGAFMALDDLLNKYGSNIMASVKELGVEASLRAADGKIYGIPYYTLPGAYPASPQYRQDWLDQLNLNIPATPEEWHQVLKAFKDAQLGGKDTIPFAPLGYNDFPIFRAFGADARMYLNSEGEYHYGPALPGMKDALMLLNQMYNEGLIDPEFAIISKQQWEAKVSLGNVGSIFYNPSRTDIFTNILSKDNPKAKMVGGGAILDKNGKGELLPDPILKGVFAISSKSKNAELIVKYFNYLSSPEGKLLTQYGIEGQSYVMKDGKPQYTDEFKKDLKNNLVNIGISTALYFLTAPLPDLFQDRNEGTLLAAAVAATKPYTIKEEPQLNFTQEEQDVITKDQQPITDKTSEYMINFIMGREPLTNFDKYVDELKKLGLEELERVYNTAYQRAISTSK